MPEASQKMQQRAALLSILNKYRKSSSVDNLELKKDIEIIKEFDDKNLVAKTLLKEINDVKTIYTNICAVIILEAVDAKVFEDEAINFLKDEKTSDDKKFFIVSLLRQKGIDFNYRDIENYINQPEKIAQSGVKDFLLNAILDPEVQIDLLDFYLNISKDERLYLLHNLIEEFSGDDLGNALSLICELDIEQDELEVLLPGLIASNSPYSLEGLEYVLNNYQIDRKTKLSVKKAIKEISFANPDFINTALTKESKIFKCYISFVDGCSNFSLVISRTRKDAAIDALLCTMNIKQGVVSCMGFGNIALQNFGAIIKRLFSDSLPVEITPEAFVSLYKHYFNKTQKPPYELIVWKKIMNDIKEIDGDISEFLNSGLKRIKLTPSKVKKFASSKMLETWYYSLGQNEKVDLLIDKIEKKHTTNLDEINEIISDFIEKEFLSDKEFLTELQSKLLIQSYAANIAKLNITAACAYSLCFDNPYTKMLVTSSIDKSLYYYFSTCAYEADEENVFKKAKIKTNYTKDELELLMAQLEEKWS